MLALQKNNLHVCDSGWDAMKGIAMSYTHCICVGVARSQFLGAYPNPSYITHKSFQLQDLQIYTAYSGYYNRFMHCLPHMQLHPPS